LRNSKGVTLIEVLIAMTILLIVFMGLISASIVAISANTRNEIRDEAVRLTSDVMTKLRVAPFDDINRDGVADPVIGVPPANQLIFNWDSDGTANGIQNIVIKNATVPLTILVTVSWLDADHKRITIRTSWTWQGETMTHTIVAFRGRS